MWTLEIFQTGPIGHVWSKQMNNPDRENTFKAPLVIFQTGPIGHVWSKQMNNPDRENTFKAPLVIGKKDARKCLQKRSHLVTKCRP